MGLYQLKKQLKRELKKQQKKKRTNRNLYLLLFTFLSALAIGSYYFYSQQLVSAPQRVFAEGIRLESSGMLQAAEEKYRNVYQQYPKTQEAAESLLRTAKLWQFSHQDTQKALLLYLKLEHEYPSSSLVYHAREEAARIVKYSLRDYSRALEFYQRLLALDTGKQDQYYFEVADCYFRLKNYPQSRIELETLLEKYPQSALVADVLYRKAGILLLEGEVEAAKSDLVKVIEKYPESRNHSQAEFDLAKIFEEEGYLTEALEYYQRLGGRVERGLLDKKIEHLKRRIAEKKEAV